METPINFSDREWSGGYTFHSPNEMLFITLKILVILKRNFILVWYFSLEWTARYSYLHLWILSQITHFWGWFSLCFSILHLLVTHRFDTFTDVFPLIIHYCLPIVYIIVPHCMLTISQEDIHWKGEEHSKV